MLKQHIAEKLSPIIKNFAKAKGLNDDIRWAIETPPKNIEADFALNAAMAIAKTLKTNPRTVACELSEHIKRNMPDIIQNCQIAGAGFINLILKDDILFSYLKEILDKKENFARRPKNSCDESILVEFVSANPTGPLHIGHGRGAVIGDSLARIFEYAGLNTKREYYLNDAGNQMQVLAKSTEIRYRQLKGENIDMPEDHYQGAYITDIAKRLVDENVEFSKIDFKQEACENILAGIKKDLLDFGVAFDKWFYESDIALKKDVDGKTEVDKICDRLKEDGFTYEKDGALWLSSTKFGDDKDRVLKRSDGRYTYLASDIAYHKNKFDRGFNKLVDLWGADHHGYTARLSASVQMLGRPKDELVIILYQLVSLIQNSKPIAMSTRTGEFITLREVMEDVGVDACRFFFLMRAADSQLDFDIDLAKKQSSENPVFYVQYVNARCNSIIKESKKYPDTSGGAVDFSVLKTKEERALIKKLIAFYDVLNLCIKSLSPHHFTNYLLELADLYHKFYEVCRVLSDDTALTKARLELVKAVMIIIKNSLGLLGVGAPAEMHK